MQRRAQVLRLLGEAIRSRSGRLLAGFQEACRSDRQVYGGMSKIIRSRQGGFLFIGNRRALLGGGSWSFRDWFRSGEQGAVYEADNPADGGPVTAYQEATGITPVTAPGQGAADCVIGFLVDKRLGGRNALGPELVTNGGFAADTDWTKGSGWSISGGTASRIADATFTNLQQSSILVIGKTYEITLDVTAISGSLIVYAGGGSGSGSITTTGSKRLILTCVTTTNLVVQCATGPTTVTIDNISVRELPGNHATQATTASKPTLSARYNLLTYSEQFDNAAWGNATMTVATGVADPNGGTSAQTLTSTAPTSYVYQSYAATVGTARNAVWIRRRSGTGNVLLSTPDQSNVNVTSQVTSSWNKITTSATSGTGTHFFLTITLATSGDAVDVFGADLRTSADAALSIPAYQRVTDASNYDTAGFPCRIKFDGFDDSLQTAAVDFTGTDKITVVAGVQKLSDAAQGMVCELSANINDNTGSFHLLETATGTQAQAALGGGSGGTIYSIKRDAGTAAPAALIRAVSFDRSLPIAGMVSLRTNGVVAAAAALTAGTVQAAFGNYAINLGRRGGSSLPLNAYLTRLIIRGAATPDSQITKAERSTAKRMALTY
jgi:hypothetical protein